MIFEIILRHKPDTGSARYDLKRTLYHTKVSNDDELWYDVTADFILKTIGKEL